MIFFYLYRSRYAHQVSACALSILQKEAFRTYKDSNPENPFEIIEWCKVQCNQHPQFLFWSTALELELLVLELVRSLRTGNFALYIQVLGKIVPWMFALDMCNYSRWLPVHIRDMICLKTKHPSVYDEFLKGKFVVQKTQKCW